MSSVPVRAADEAHKPLGMRPGQTIRLGIPGSTATVLPDSRSEVAGEHVGGDGEDHSGVGGGQHSVRHCAHRTAFHAAVVVGHGRAGIVRPMLSMYRVMAVFAGLIVMAHDARTMLDADCGDRRQL